MLCRIEIDALIQRPNQSCTTYYSAQHNGIISDDGMGPQFESSGGRVTAEAKGRHLDTSIYYAVSGRLYQRG